MIKLSDKTKNLVEILYSSEHEQQRVISVLENQCADNVPFCKDKTPEKMERIRFAVLKLDQEKGKFDEWVKLACIDWRDLFMAAGFGYNIQEHQKWASSILKRE